VTRAELLSVNVGRPRDVVLPERTISTAIWKTPVDGPVDVRGVNVAGDDQADRTVHGGPDKAVYAYGMDETLAWEEDLGRHLGAGAFGENLTIGSYDVSGARVGEQWRVGTVLFEVVQPRLPCFKLGLKFGDPSFVRRFALAGRPGAYLRIVSEGVAEAGDAVEVVRVPDHDVTMRLMMHAALVDKTRLPELLAAPGLIDDWREWAEQHAA
jgi:MOSC domain-containing protein YiiM